MFFLGRRLCDFFHTIAYMPKFLFHDSTLKSMSSSQGDTRRNSLNIGWTSFKALLTACAGTLSFHSQRWECVVKSYELLLSCNWYVSTWIVSSFELASIGVEPLSGVHRWETLEEWEEKSREGISAKSDVFWRESLIISLARALCTFSFPQDPLVGGAYFSALTVPDKPLDQVLPQFELFTV